MEILRTDERLVNLPACNTKTWKKTLRLLLVLFALPLLGTAQTAYTYSTEGFDGGVFPASSGAAPTALTWYTTSTGTWGLFKGYTTTSSDPCPNGNGNMAVRLPSNAAAYVVTPFLARGAGVVTLADGRTNRVITYWTSTDDGANWSAPLTVNTGSSTCAGMTITINNLAVNRMKFANMGTNDAGIDNVLITPAGINMPFVNTTVATGITVISANSGGNVWSDGGATVSDRGLVWSTSAGPTVAANTGIVHNGTGTGTFSTFMAGLVAGQTYYYRAFATNSAGTSYGTEYSFTTPPATPTLIANPATLAFGTQTINTSSSVQTYSVQGVYLSPAAGNITLTAPAGYKISTSLSTPFTTTVSLPYTGNTLAPTTIYVRFAPAAVGFQNGNIAHSGGGATATVAVTGSGGAILNGVTNVGFDFWTGFGYQEKMNQKSGNPGEALLSLYISVPEGSTPASVIVELPGIPGASNFPRTVTVTPGTITEVTGFPTGDASSQYNANKLPDTRLYYTGVSSRGIHIYSANGVPISVWMHSYTTGKSAAGAMLFPTNTWASNYTVQAYGGKSNNSNPNSFFFVVAKEDNTPIWFTASQNVLDSVTGALFTEGHTPAMVRYQRNVEYGPIILNKGQVFNAMGFIQGSGDNTALGLDLSGSTVKTNCDKAIAVFGGNGRCLVNPGTCNAPDGSDHMIQQMFPSVAWGKRYLTVPTRTMEFNLYRIYVSDPATRVWVNNAAHTTPLTGIVNNLYYEFTSKLPQLIESDKPISVSQFVVAGDCATANGARGQGDPEFIILSPVEQAINKTTVYSARIKNTTSTTTNGHYINVIIPQGGVASFRLDGATTGDPGVNQATITGTGGTVAAYGAGTTQPLSAIFQPHPQLPGYAYGTFRVTPGASHTLYSDSAFNAIAYGMGDGESYGYNAGCSLKDLSQQVLLGNPYGVTKGLTCKDNPFYFRVALPYAPADLVSLTWDFNNEPAMTPNANVVQNLPTPDSTYTTDGVPYYVYRIPTTYSISQAGTYSFRVKANALTSGGCTGEKIFNSSITVVDGPVPYFNFTAGTCGSTALTFSDASTSDSTLVNSWNWNFGDGSTLADTSHLQNPAYTYPALGAFTVTLQAINAAGCVADTTRTIDLGGNLNASFTMAPASPVCAGTAVTFTDASTAGGTYGTINEWTWDFGDGSPVVVATNGGPQTHTYTAVGTWTVTLKVKTSLGCTSTLYTQTIIVAPVPAVTSSNSASVCSGSALDYTITSSVPGATYTWSRAAVAGISNAAVSGQTSNPITETLVNTTAAPINVVYTIIPRAGTCDGAAFTLTVTVNPTATITSAATASICSGTAQNYTITSNVAGATFAWSRPVVAGISNPAVSGSSANPITESLVNTTAAPINVIYTITPTFAGCAGTPFTYTVTVNPTATVTSAATAAVCSGAPFSYTITGSVTGSAFSWGRPAVAGISNAPATGSTASINETLVNSTVAPVVVTYTITPTANGCAGTPFTLSVTVNPRPTITSAATGSICGSNALNYLITSNVTGATFTWDRAAVAGISNAAVSGQTANPITETLFNTTTSPINVVYNITPSFAGCAGTAFTYTVTVNPTPVVTSAATGNVCSGNPLTYTISTTVAGSDFTWSRPAVTGISNPAVTNSTVNPINETLVNTTTNVVNVTYLVVTSFSGCTSQPFNYVVTVTPTPTVTSAATATVCSGAALSYTITSGVTGATFSWSRAAVAGISNAAVSNQATNPIGETLVNTSNAPVSVVYNITPSANGCTGTPFTLTVTVNPTAAVTSAATATVCNNTAQNYSITSNVSGAVFSWSRPAVSGISNPAVVAQTGTITETLVNTTSAPIDVVYTITPSFALCTGTVFTYTVTVNPTATVTSAASATLCSGTPMTYNITSAVSGATYSWSRPAVTGISNPAVSGSSANPISETLVNTTGAAINVVYTITPTANGCAGTPFTYTVTVNPTPSVTSAATGSICGGTALNYAITGNVAGSTFSWNRPAVAGISNAAVSNSSANPITETLVNTTTAPIDVVYTIMPSGNGCAGTPFTYTVTVNPTPAISSAATGAVCSGQPLSYLVTSNVPGAVYTWTRAAVAGISNPAVSNQTSNPIAETLDNTTTNVVNVVYSIVAGFGGCNAPAFTYTVTVTPAPAVTSAAAATVCNNTAQNYTITSTVTGTTFNWSRAAVAGISNPAVSNQASNNITETLVNTSDGPVTVTYVINTQANGCPGATFNYLVTVNPTARVTSAATGTTCSGATQAYSIQSNVTGATFSWSRAAVAGISNAAVTGQTSTTISEALVNTTVNAIDVVYTITPSFGGCAGTPFTYTVTVYPAARITSAAALSTCSNSNFQYNITGAVAGTSYTWNRPAVAGITNPAVVGSTGNPISETLVNTTAAAIPVPYSITPSANGCAGAAFTLTVTVNPEAIVTSAATKEVCSDASVNYTINTNVTGATVLWSRPAVAGISNPAVTAQGARIITEALINTTNAPIVVAYTITPSAGTCGGVPFTLDVTVHPTPTAAFTVAQASQCVNGPVSFTPLSSTPAIASYIWNFGDNSPNSTVQAPVHNYTNGGHYEVVLTATSAAGCKGVSTPHPVDLLPLLPAPRIHVTATTSSLLFAWDSIPGASGYLVSLDGGVTFVAPTGNFSHFVDGLVPQQNVSIIVQVNGAMPCQQNSTTLTTAVPLPDVGIFVPNTISPNGDGRNDKLRVLGNNIASVQLNVYNQWGQLLYSYQGKDPSNGWDGTVSGTLQPVAVYAYAVEVKLTDGRVITKKGLFNLIR